MRRCRQRWIVPPNAPRRNTVACALALAVLPADPSPIGYRPRWTREAGGFLPPVALPRRMWAGSQFEFHGPLRVGDALTRVSTIHDISEKSGRTGPLVFVKVRHEIRARDESEIALTEFHDIVYREAPKPDDVAPPPRAAPAKAAWTREWVPDDVLLFRYSALTFNGHRIHYDRRYVTEVEGYPGLIVHGPLIATLCSTFFATSCRTRRWLASSFARCVPCSTSIISSSAASPPPTARLFACGPKTMKAGSRWIRPQWSSKSAPWSWLDERDASLPGATACSDRER